MSFKTASKSPLIDLVKSSKEAIIGANLRLVLTMPLVANLIRLRTCADFAAICASRSAPISPRAAIIPACAPVRTPRNAKPTPLVPTTASTTAYSICPTSSPTSPQLLRRAHSFLN